MRYTKGSIGRIFLVKFDNNDVFLDKIGEIARKERIKAAAFMFIGALKKGDIVTGPKKPVIPPEANWTKFKDGWEVLGMGTLFMNKKGPQIHAHTAMGKKGNTITGCIRKKTEVFLVIEAVIFELKGVKASKDIDPATGLNLLRV